MNRHLFFESHKKKQTVLIQVAYKEREDIVDYFGMYYAVVMLYVNLKCKYEIKGLYTIWVNIFVF